MLDAAHRPFCPPNTTPTWIRPRHFRITHVVLQITIDVDQQRIAGVVEHHVELLAHGDARCSVELDQHDLTLGEITVDGHGVTASQGEGRVVVTLPATVTQQFVLRVPFSVERPQKPQ
jgi:aminopeptidase N